MIDISLTACDGVPGEPTDLGLKEGTLVPRTALPIASARSLGAPAVIGSIALSLAALPGDSTAAATPRPDEALRAVADESAAGADGRARVVGSPAASRAVPIHSVAEGETVSSIAARHGVRTADVLAWNDLGWRSIIRPGDVLRLGAPARDEPERAHASPKSASHTVATGDTLWSIATRHGVSVAALANANALGASTVIRPGQTLAVPARADVRPAAGKTAAPPAPAGAASVHEVAAGQTLWSIADRNGVSLARLLSENGLDLGSIIYPGQKLRIPAPAAPAAATSTAITTEAQAARVVLDDEQIANVRTIIAVGRDRGVSRDGIAVALGTAMVESWIRNLDWGDRDSLGLFQQRPSAGWGDERQIRDTRRATAAFFGGPRDPNGDRTRGLLDVPGWEAMSFTDAAQAVQISAHPDRYGAWEEQAYRWVDLYG